MNMNFGVSARLAFIAVGAVVASVGCQPAANQGTSSTNSSSAASSGQSVKLVAGKLDTATILQSDPDYMTLAQDYLREQTELRAKTGKEAQKLGGDRAALEGLQKKYMGEQKELDKKWMGKTQEFLTARHSKMKTIVEGICQDKKMDIVVIDSKQYPTVEWGGFDITQDVLLKTQGGGAPLNSATPSPTPK